MEERKKKEKDFHDWRERDRNTLGEEDFLEKYSNNKFYSVVRKSTQYIHDFIEKNCPGSKVLDYCCGLGGISLEIAESGGLVYGIDISEESVRTARRKLEDAGYGANSKFYVMDAEKLDFESGFFDVVICSGVLHHLDLNRAFPELSRVLKPGGCILCIEALGYNPVIRWYRKRTPQLRTEWEQEHILTMRDIELAKKHFRSVEVKFFHLFSILAVPFRKIFLFNPLLGVLEFFDSIILRIPLIRLMAWQMAFVLSDPVEAGAVKTAALEDR